MYSMVSSTGARWALRAATARAQAANDYLLNPGDVLQVSVWNEEELNREVLVRPDGGMYAIADNAYSDSELAGVCFSPDGQTLFVNVQYPGTTLAITGPFPT